MPIKITSEGWVKVPPQQVKSRKPKDPLAAYRGPLAYITGQKSFAEPVKKTPIQDLIVRSAPPSPPPEPFYEERAPARPRKPRSRVPSAPAAIPHSRFRHQTEVLEEVDEEISRPGLRLEDVRSQRSASPNGSRYHGAAATVEKSRRNRNDERSDRDRYKHRDDRSERSYHRERRPSHHQSYGQPTLQPIIIYSTPPQMGCGGGCGHGYGQIQHQYYGPPVRQMLEPPPLPTQPIHQPASPQRVPKPAPSVVSSASGSSEKSRSKSYSWYNATAPLNL